MLNAALIKLDSMSDEDFIYLLGKFGHDPLLPEVRPSSIPYYEALSYTSELRTPLPFENVFILREGLVPLSHKDKSLAGKRIFIVDKGEYNGDNVGSCLIWTIR